MPAIARRASISHQTFYQLYSSKLDALLGAQKVGLHQALLVTGEAYRAQPGQWPRAVAAGLRALLGYLVCEPAHARLGLVETFAASPAAIELRNDALRAFTAFLEPGLRAGPDRSELPAVVAEAVAGGVWQLLRHHVETDRLAELPAIAPQLLHFTLAPFLGPEQALQLSLLQGA